jgi:hypothetical protein
VSASSFEGADGEMAGYKRIDIGLELLPVDFPAN